MNFTQNSKSYEFCGSYEYLSPEMISDNIHKLQDKSYKEKGHGTMVDIYSLGVLLYEMLIGHPPFSDTNTIKLFHKIMDDQPTFPLSFPSDTKDFILKLLEKDPERRLGSINGFHEIRSHEYLKNVPWNSL